MELLDYHNLPGGVKIIYENPGESTLNSRLSSFV